MKLVVAVNNKGYIGNNGELMWRSKADLQHFKTLTEDGLLVVGNTTYVKCLGGKSLPGRPMYIIGGIHYTLPNGVTAAIVCGFLENKDVWVIGGSEIYKQLLPMCDEIHISKIDDDQVGDTTFEIPKDYRGVVITYNFDTDGETDKSVEPNKGDVTSE